MTVGELKDYIKDLDESLEVAFSIDGDIKGADVVTSAFVVQNATSEIKTYNGLYLVN